LKELESEWKTSSLEWWMLAVIIVLAKPFSDLHALLGTAIWLGAVFVFIFTGPIKRSLLFVMAFIVYYQQSVWYILDDVPLTIYEIEFVHFKPVEIIYGMIFLKSIFLGMKFVKLPKGLLIVLGLWIFCISNGVSISLYNQNKIYDMFIFSEFRTLCWSFLLLIVFFNFCKQQYLWVVKSFIILVAVKCVVTIPDYLGLFSLLWPASIANYSGSVSAFFGGDPDVLVVCMAYSIIFAMLVVPKISDKMVPVFSHNWTWILAGIFLFTIVLSLRRGGIMAAFISMGILMCFSNFKVKLGFFIFSILGLSYVAVDIAGDLKTLPGPVYAMTDRFTGKGKVAKSNLGHVLDIKDGIREINEYFWLGKGVGARMLSFRAAEVHGAEVHSSILVHQNVLHTWLKYGLIGVVAYFLTFFVPLLTVVKFRGPYKGIDIAIMLGAGSFLISRLLWAFLTPPFFQTLRVNFLVFMAVFLLYASLDGAIRDRKKLPVSV
tara:strand:- start:12860 stop:14326 length:1467 start_codon:yes stop_codon:yes gene_type:complete